MGLLRLDQDGCIVEHLRPPEPFEVDAEHRGHVLRVHDDVVIKLDIFGRDGPAVAPARFRVDLESKLAAVGRHVPRFGEDAHGFVFCRMQSYEAFKKQAHDFSGQGVVVEPGVERFGEPAPPFIQGPAAPGVRVGNGVDVTFLVDRNRRN